MADGSASSASPRTPTSGSAVQASATTPTLPPLAAQHQAEDGAPTRGRQHQPPAQPQHTRQRSAEEAEDASSSSDAERLPSTRDEAVDSHAEAVEESSASSAAARWPQRKRQRLNDSSAGSGTAALDASRKQRRGGMEPHHPPPAPELSLYEYSRQYEIEKIVARRVRSGSAEYLIQWKGYSAAHNSWEPADNLTLHALEWFEEDMEAGRRDKRSGRLKAGSRQRKRSAKPATGQAQRPEHRDNGLAEEVESEEGGRLDKKQPEMNPLGGRKEHPEEHQPHSDTHKESGDAQQQLDEPRQPATGDNSRDSNVCPLAVATAAAFSRSSAAVIAPSARPRRAIRHPRPYSPSHYPTHYTWTRAGSDAPAPTATATAKLKKRAVGQSDDAMAQSSEEDSEAKQQAVMQSAGSAIDDGEHSSGKLASFRRQKRLHVQISRAELDDVIDLASSASGRRTSAVAEQPTQQHSDTPRIAAAAHAQQCASADECADASSSAAVETSSRAAIASELEVGKPAPAVAELSDASVFEVECVVDRRFNAQSIAAGCCVAPASESSGGTGSSEHTLLPADEWDEGCSGKRRTHSTQSVACT